MPEVGVQGTHAAKKNRHLGSSQLQQLRPIQQQLVQRALLPLPDVVAERICRWLENRERVHIGQLLRSIRASWRERNLHVVSGLFRSSLDSCIPTENNQVSQRHLLAFAAVGLRAVELPLDRFELLQNLG